MEAILSLGGALLTRSGSEEPFLTVKSFEIQNPGVYTLEGPNGSGKSMFIRFLTGTLPGSIEDNFGASLRIKGARCRIYNYRDALKYGIVSVFQDDDLVSSMTVFENILLRHGTSNLKKVGHYAWDYVFNIFSPPVTSFIRLLGPVLSPKAQVLLERLEPQKIDWKSRKYLRDRATLLLGEHGVPSQILDEMPSRLSGGGRAAAKLICAQLHDNTKILLLDEAFNGVERLVWPRFVDGIKAWAHEKGAVVVAITHSSEELQHWDPLARFDIRDGFFVVDEEFFEGSRRQTPPPRQVSSPIFELAARLPERTATSYASFWKLLGPGTELIGIVDGDASETSIVDAMSKYCPRGYNTRKVSLGSDVLDSLDAVIGRIEQLRPNRRAVIVVAGRASLCVLSSIALLVTQHLATAAIVIAPTSFEDAVRAILSHAVAITTVGPNGRAGAIALATSFTPEAFVVPIDSLESMSSTEIKLSLVPCLRLGLLFDEEFFGACKDAFLMAKCEPSTALKILRRAVSVLNEISELGPQSSGIARVARFGDSHAAMIEQVTHGRVEGGQALLWGMILEATVSQSSFILGGLRLLTTTIGTTVPSELLDHSNWPQIEKFYQQECDLVDGERHITNLMVQDVAQFSVSNFREKLASTPNRQNRNLARFANVQADGSLHHVAIYKLQVALAELAASFQADSVLATSHQHGSRPVGKF